MVDYPGDENRRDFKEHTMKKTQIDSIKDAIDRLEDTRELLKNVLAESQKPATKGEQVLAYVTEKGDPSVGWFDQTFVCEVPEIEPESVEDFRAALKELYQQFVEGEVQVEFTNDSFDDDVRMTCDFSGEVDYCVGTSEKQEDGSLTRVPTPLPMISRDQIVENWLDDTGKKHLTAQEEIKRKLNERDPIGAKEWKCGKCGRNLYQSAFCERDDCPNRTIIH